jgi:hypothetical protein
MAETKVKMVIPGLETEEGQARIVREVEARHEVDFRAYRLLRQLVEDDFLSYQTMYRGLKADGVDEEEAQEMAQELDEMIQAVIRDRHLADHRVLEAMAGRDPGPREA